MQPLVSATDIQLLNDNKIEVIVEDKCGIIIHEGRRFKVNILNRTALDASWQSMELNEEQMKATARKVAVILLKKELIQKKQEEQPLKFKINQPGITCLPDHTLIQHENDITEKNTRGDYDSLVSYLKIEQNAAVLDDDLDDDLDLEDDDEDDDIKEEEDTSADLIFEVNELPPVFSSSPQKKEKEKEKRKSETAVPPSPLKVTEESKNGDTFLYPLNFPKKMKPLPIQAISVWQDSEKEAEQSSTSKEMMAEKEKKKEKEKEDETKASMSIPSVTSQPKPPATDRLRDICFRAGNLFEPFEPY
jgi:hypothetical protein